jgi:hypothetical protein
MEVINYLNSLCEQGASSYAALGILEETLGVKFSCNPDYPLLVCLNYDQISSKKFDPVVRECRSLVLGIRESSVGEEFYVVSRSFDRFFNLGEEQGKDYDITQMHAYEKVDGSLVGLFYYNGEWLYRTRSMIMPSPELKVNGSKLSWKDLIESALKDFVPANQDITYIFEVVSPENRVVTRYPDKAAYLLAKRYKDGTYSTFQKTSGVLVPQTFTFNTLEHCLEACRGLRDLQEGYVLYDYDGVPRVKVKNPAYVAAHHLRGEGMLSSKRIMDLIIMNETSEYLTIFPEDTERFTPYMEAYTRSLFDCATTWQEVENIEDQKQFALLVKDHPYSGILFKKKQNPDKKVIDLFNEMSTNAKYRLIESYLEEENA